MDTTRLSSKGQIILPKAVRDQKGQIILPKAVRDQHHWGPGTDFTVEDTCDGILLRPLKSRKPSRLEDVVGCLKYRGPAKTIEEMDAAIDAELQARRDRGRY